MNQRKNEEHYYADVLVVGGGMAGLFAAIKARLQGLDVILTDKGFVGRSGGTHYAEGDIQFFRPQRGHDMKAWLDYISEGSEYVNNRDWNEIVLNEVEDRYHDLVDWGVKFYETNGALQIEGPHVFFGTPPLYEIIAMRNREYAPSLRSKAMNVGVRIYDKVMTSELLKQDGRIVGAMGFNTTSGKVVVFHAKATVISTGAGTAYKSRSMNTDYWTSDGECMAYRTGAEVAGKEFRHTNLSPTRDTLDAREKIYDGSEMPGKKLDITQKYPYATIQSGWFWPVLNAENKPTIDGGAWDAHTGKAPVYYDLDKLSPMLTQHHKNYFKRVGSVEPDKLGLDFFNGGKLYYPSSRVQLNTPVGGGGIWPVNKFCASNIPGLFAAGASCATMVSGARYGGMGMGLSSGMVTGTRVAQAAAEYVAASGDLNVREDTIERARDIVRAPIDRRGGFSPAWVTQVLQGTIVPYYVMVIKNEKRLLAALTMVKFMKENLVPQMKANDPHEWRLAHETKNMVLNAEMQLRASLFRTESRGSHFREDYPRRCDPEWLSWTKLKEINGHMELEKEPIPERLWPDLSKPYEELYPVRFPLE